MTPLSGYLDIGGGSWEEIDAQIAAFLEDRPEPPSDADALEVSAVAVYPDPNDAQSTICEPLHPGDEWSDECIAVIWSIYWHNKNGGVECFGDALNRPQIERVYQQISKAWGIA